ncbi:hypothetical protein ABI54_25695 [Salmonella enterica]|nr:hypothetical protein [Salmonella enterica]EBK2836480.1 hypothetical protein [Salmonella enterica]
MVRHIDMPVYQGGGTGRDPHPVLHDTTTLVTRARPQMFFLAFSIDLKRGVALLITDSEARESQNLQTVPLRERFIHRNGAQLCG